MSQVIALTGATGFIGQSICRRLAADGHCVRALVRNPRASQLPPLHKAEIIVGDLASSESLDALVSGADALVHCAGGVRGATQEQFDKVNVAGTRNVLQALQRATNPPRLLAISSLAAREPQLSFYSKSKRMAEKALHDEGADISITIVRPPAVYGPGDRELLPLFRLMARGIALTAGAPSARFSMIYVEDLSAAISAWLRSESPVPGIYTLDDGTTLGYNWFDISRTVGSLCNRRIRVMQAPRWLLDAPAWVISRIGRYFGTAPMLTPQKLRELRHPDWVCDSVDFQRNFDWTPETALLEGLRSTPDWPGHGKEGQSAGRSNAT